MDQLEYPNGMSIIARTAGIGRSAPELQWDLNYLLKLWSAIDGAAKGGKGAFLIYQESSLVIRAIRDYFNHDIGDILIDTDDVYEQAQQFMAHVMPEHAARVKRYRDDAPLFSRFQIEHQIESAYARTVQLPSGGAIVIDHTEALVSVDVNSARAIKGGDIEETATRTNLEAADEVARQMRLRDLGGLIVIDFIDMEESRNRREVENRLRDALRQDRARVQFGTISKFGLMEMSRQRLRPALSEGASIPCPRCGGSGHIRDTESSALQILRIIQEESLKDNTASVLCQVPVEVASFLLNEKRTEIAKIELKQRINVLMVPNKTLETPNYKLERLKHDDPRLDQIQASYKMADVKDEATSVTRRSQEPTNKQTPVIKGVLPDAPAPVAPPKPVAAPVAPAPVATPAAAAEKSGGFFAWLKSLFGGEAAPAPVVAPVATPAKPEGQRDSRPGRDGQRGNRNGERRPRPEGRDGNRNGAERGAERNGERGGRNGGRNGERGGERNGQSRDRQDGENRQTAAFVADGAPEAGRNEGGREQRPPRGERNERGPRGPRNQEAQGENRNTTNSEAGSGAEEALNLAQAPAGEGNDVRHEGRSERGERGGRNRGRGGRGERQERAPREEANAVAEGGTPASAEGANEGNSDAVPQHSTEAAQGEGRERRSRDRYGRDRGNRGDRASRPPRGEEPSQEALPFAEAPVMATAVPVVAAPAAAPSTAPAVATMPRVTRFELPLDDLAQIAQSSGLQWVNSNAERVAAVAAAIAAEPKPVHVPRERPAPVAIDDRPLVLVETRRDLRNMTLPFEETAAG
jgi:ribonuclease E